jgi:hypothetical protein
MARVSPAASGKRGMRGVSVSARGRHALRRTGIRILLGIPMDLCPTEVHLCPGKPSEAGCLLFVVDRGLLRKRIRTGNANRFIRPSQQKRNSEKKLRESPFIFQGSSLVIVMAVGVHNPFNREVCHCCDQFVPLDGRKGLRCSGSWVPYPR